MKYEQMLEGVNIGGTEVPRLLASDKTITLATGIIAGLSIKGHVGGARLKLTGGWSAATATTGSASGAAGVGTTTTSIVKPTGADDWTVDDLNGKHARVKTYDTLTLTQSAASVVITANSPGVTPYKVQMVEGSALAVRWKSSTNTLIVTVDSTNGTSDDNVAAAINASDAKGLLTAVSGSGGNFDTAQASAELTGGSSTVVAITDTSTTALSLGEAVTGLAAGVYFEALDPSTTVTTLMVQNCLCPVEIENINITALDVDLCRKATLTNCVLGTVAINDCDKVVIDSCGQDWSSAANVHIQDCQRVNVDDCALSTANLRTTGCDSVEGDSAVGHPRVDKLDAAVAAAGGDLTITGRNLVGQLSFDTLAVTLGDSAGTVTVTAAKPGDSSLTFEILASDTGTTLGVTKTGNAIAVQLAEAGNTAAEIIAEINGDAKDTDGVLRATASGSGTTTSAVASAALTGGVGDYSNTKVIIGNIDTPPANDAAGAAEWSDTQIVCTVTDDHSQNEIVGVTVMVDGDLSNQVSYVVA